MGGNNTKVTDNDPFNPATQYSYVIRIAPL